MVKLCKTIRIIQDIEFREKFPGHFVRGLKLIDLNNIEHLIISLDLNCYQYKKLG